MYMLKKCLLLFVVILMALSILFTNITLLQSKDLFKYLYTKIPHYQKYESEIGCYGDKYLDSLEDISDLSRPPENSIFFHETSCKSYNHGRIVIGTRQACAVESAAFTHPNRSIYLLYTSPGLIQPGSSEQSDLILAALRSYDNVHILHADYRRYISNTPVEYLYTSGRIRKSKYPLVHASDIMRYLTLYKYGGVYLDLDVLMMKSLDELGPNFSGMEDDKNVAAGFIGLSSTVPGHSWAELCLNDLSKNYNGKKWGANSVGVMTRLVKSLCPVELKVVNHIIDCNGFKVTASTSFYPIPYRQWRQYFDPNRTETVLKTIGKSYAIHMWNKLSHNKTAETGSTYAMLAKKYCPKVFAANGGQVL